MITYLNIVIPTEHGVLVEIGPKQYYVYWGINNLYQTDPESKFGLVLRWDVDKEGNPLPLPGKDAEVKTLLKYVLSNNNGYFDFVVDVWLTRYAFAYKNDIPFELMDMLIFGTTGNSLRDIYHKLKE